MTDILDHNQETLNNIYTITLNMFAAGYIEWCGDQYKYVFVLDAVMFSVFNIQMCNKNTVTI